MSYQLVFERRFIMGHRLIAGSSVKCSIPHGHNEYVKVVLKAHQESALDGHENFLELFETAKQRWHQFIDHHLDHTLQLSHTDPLIDYFKTHEPAQLQRLVVTYGDPTTELLCACLMSKLTHFLKTDKSPLYCAEIQLRETPTNTVVLSGAQAFTNVLPVTLRQRRTGTSYWWERADFSINEFPKAPHTT